MSQPFTRPRVFTQSLLLATLMCAALAVAAQPPPRRGPPPVNGTITAVHGRHLQITTTTQDQVTVMLAPKVNIIDEEPTSLSAVTAGRFIGTTAVQRADGKLYATEIHIFPESMRGTGEGHYPMGPPNTTMTNGNVEAVTGSVAQAGAGAGSGLVLRISYKGGQSEVEVPPNVTVTMMSVGKRSLLKPGLHVTVFARPSGSKVPTAAAVIVHGQRSAD